MPGTVYSIAMSPIATTHALLAVASSDQQVRLCDLSTGSSTHTLFGHREGVLATKWSPYNEFLLATGSLDSTIRLWDIRKSHSCLISLDSHQTRSLTHNESKIRNQNAPSSLGGKKSATATAHDGIVTSLEFTPDGLFLLSSGTDNRLRLWNTHTGVNTLVTYSGIKNNWKKGTQISVSSNGMIVFHPNERVILAFDIFSGELLYTLNAHYAPICCCRFNPVIEELYSSGHDAQILVWSPPTDCNPLDSQKVEHDQDNWSGEETT